jgi:hypothetical protein
MCLPIQNKTKYYSISFKRSPVLKDHYFFFLSRMWPLNTGLIVFLFVPKGDRLIKVWLCFSIDLPLAFSSMNPKHNPHIAETINLPTQPALQHDVSCVGFLSLSFLFSTSLLFISWGIDNIYYAIINRFILNIFFLNHTQICPIRCPIT